MKKTLAFDGQDQQCISECRKEFLEHLLQNVSIGLDLKTGLDAGCGIGFFSNYLSSRRLKVSAFDAREKNIAEAVRRYSGVEFLIRDVEDPSVQKLGQFDLVLCFGLLYHLENPFLAIRNLHALTEQILIIETMVTPSQSTVATLVSECQEEDQGLHFIAFIPSEACVIKMLYQAGFPKVYKTIELPDHEDFRRTLSHNQRRTVLVASKVKLQSPLLRWVAEPQPQRLDIWRKRLTFPIKLIPRFRKKPRSRIHAVCSKVRSWLPLPVRLPWGQIWLAWDDVMGKHIRYGDNFEQGEQSFLLRYLELGMTVLDIGAHQGLYTLLASKKVGEHGHVIAFEPSPRELRRLRLHLFLNRCRNVYVVPSALGGSEKTAELFVCLGQETGSNSLRPPAVSEPVSKVQVRMTTLDRYLQRARMDRVDFIKLDVEGAELEVLKGAGQLLSSFKPIILCELADVRTEPWGYRSIDIFEFLEAHGYCLFSVTPSGKLRSCPKKTQYHENLIAVPEEKLPSVAAYVEESG
jgi:FkbM family methyltransferase